MRHLDHAHASLALLLHDLITERLHSRPMHLWPEMVLGVITVVEPRPVIELPIGAHAPGDGLVGIAAIVPVVSIQIREAMAEIPKRQKETDVMPVKDAENDKRCDEACQTRTLPKRPRAGSCALVP